MSTNKAIRRSIGVSNIDEKRARYHARPDEYKETDLARGRQPLRKEKETDADENRHNE
ncbi:hypothetical protein OB955_14730 [Halobacteria archaeon AArc-m2/3/4]|uniref:Uncharacterized protein n=1 Tax=Natronoglomus mannanivorans TaxID=2979990 RepID=A0ABT2QGE1_9EURY|nr:hypothetical protein [Halobacteria archaeon AArc-m2/3/4]